jgi:hypothetical protein
MVAHILGRELAATHGWAYICTGLADALKIL